MTSTARLSYTDGLPGKNPKERTEPHGRGDGADKRLVQGCAAQDPAALREIVERYQPALYRFLSQILGSSEDTEEAVLDVFLRVWQQAHRFEGRASFATWLYRIASNVAYDRLRHRKGQPRATSWEDNTAAAAESINAEEMALNRLEREERSRRLQQALHSLRVEDRLLLVLYYTEELCYEEIAQITKYSYPVLKMRLMRARRRLRTQMDALMPEDGK